MLNGILGLGANVCVCEGARACVLRAGASTGVRPERLGFFGAGLPVPHQEAFPLDQTAGRIAIRATRESVALGDPLTMRSHKDGQKGGAQKQLKDKHKGETKPGNPHRDK